MCAPNDVWSLGVILVNLTCGRNPWKQASFQDSTYRAYAGSKDFLKTILPLSEELNDILGRIFNPIPEQRITLPELRTRIMACSQFTVPPMSTIAPPTPPASPDHIIQYVDHEDAILDDYEYDSPLSPASSDDEGSLTSSGSTIDDLDDDDFLQDQHQDYTHTYDPEEPREQLNYHSQEFVPQNYSGPVPVPVSMVVPTQPMLCSQVPVPVQIQVQAPIPVQAPCHPKSYFPIWDMVKYVQQVPMLQHHVPFHQQVPFMPTFQGCY